MAQSVKNLALDLGSGHDLKVHEIEPCVGLCAGSMETAWEFLYPPPSVPALLMLSLSLSVSLCLSLPKINKHEKNILKKSFSTIKWSVFSYASVAQYSQIHQCDPLHKQEKAKKTFDHFSRSRKSI